MKTQGTATVTESVVAPTGTYSESLTISGVPVATSVSTSVPDPLSIGTVNVSTSLTISGVPVSTGTSGGGGGTTDHSALTNLDFNSSGHTGFASSAELVSTSGSLSAEIDADIGTHTTDSAAHHSRYNDSEATAALAPTTGELAASGVQNRTLILTTSGHLQTQIDSIDVDEVEPALIGADGVIVLSGTDTTTISGFHGEFLSASGVLQAGIDDNADITFQEVYDNSTGFIVTDAGKPVAIVGPGGTNTAVSITGQTVIGVDSSGAISLQGAGTTLVQTDSMAVISDDVTINTGNGVVDDGEIQITSSGVTVSGHHQVEVVSPSVVISGGQGIGSSQTIVMDTLTITGDTGTTINQPDVFINGTTHVRDVVAQADNTYDVGSSTNHFRTIFLGNDGGNALEFRTARSTGSPTSYTFFLGGGSDVGSGEGGTFTFLFDDITGTNSGDSNNLVFDLGKSLLGDNTVSFLSDVGGSVGLVSTQYTYNVFDTTVAHSAVGVTPTLTFSQDGADLNFDVLSASDMNFTSTGGDFYFFTNATDSLTTFDGSAGQYVHGLNWKGFLSSDAGFLWSQGNSGIFAGAFGAIPTGQFIWSPNTTITQASAKTRLAAVGNPNFHTTKIACDSLVVSNDAPFLATADPNYLRFEIARHAHFTNTSRFDDDLSNHGALSTQDVTISGHDGAANLHFNDDAGNEIWEIASVNATSAMVFQKDGTTNVITINGDSINNNLVLNDGNVGLNTPSPSERLHVVGSGLISDDLTVQGTTVNLANLPTASGSLNAGDLWVDLSADHTLKVTPA